MRSHHPHQVDDYWLVCEHPERPLSTGGWAASRSCPHCLIILEAAARRGESVTMLDEPGQRSIDLDTALALSLEAQA